MKRLSKTDRLEAERHQRIAEQKERRLQARAKREERLLEEMKARGIDPGTEAAAHYRNRFLRGGSEVNVALSMASLLETRDNSLILDAILELDLSPLYKHLTDEAFYTQDQNSVDGEIFSNSYLLKDARLIVAGMIMERNARRRRKQRSAMAKQAEEIRCGVRVNPDSLIEKLP